MIDFTSFHEQEIEQAYTRVAYEKIYQAQQAEITYLTEYYSDLTFSTIPVMEKYDATLYQQSLKQRNIELDQANATVILGIINTDLSQTALDISTRHLTRIPDILFSHQSLPNYWTHVEKLTCQNNKIRILPESINKLPYLTYLDCSENELTIFPKSIKKLKHLQHLNYSHNQINIFQR